MNDKLKEIRDKYIIPRQGGFAVFHIDGVKKIQSETYQLGGDEMIEEALKIFEDIPYHDVPVLIDQYGGTNIETRVDIQKLKDKLNQLKEQK